MEAIVVESRTASGGREGLFLQHRNVGVGVPLVPVPNRLGLPHPSGQRLVERPRQGVEDRPPVALCIGEGPEGQKGGTLGVDG